MKVYVVESGCYDSRYIDGVYATAEAAIEANPVPEDGRATVLRRGGWKADGEGHWSNGLDWDWATHIYEHEVKS